MYSVVKPSFCLGLLAYLFIFLQVEPSESAIKRLRETVGEVCPGYSEKVSTEQACYLPATDDGVPIIGKIKDVEGAYIATGHSVWGILNSPATGKAMAELIVDGRCTWLNLDSFNPARFM